MRNQMFRIYWVENSYHPGVSPAIPAWQDEILRTGRRRRGLTLALPRMRDCRYLDLRDAATGARGCKVRNGKNARGGAGSIHMVADNPHQCVTPIVAAALQAQRYLQPLFEANSAAGRAPHWHGEPQLGQPDRPARGSRYAVPYFVSTRMPSSLSMGVGNTPPTLMMTVSLSMDMDSPSRSRTTCRAVIRVTVVRSASSS